MHSDLSFFSLHGLSFARFLGLPVDPVELDEIDTLDVSEEWAALILEAPEADNWHVAPDVEARGGAVDWKTFEDLGDDEEAEDPSEEDRSNLYWIDYLAGSTPNGPVLADTITFHVANGSLRRVWSLGGEGVTLRLAAATSGDGQEWRVERHAFVSEGQINYAYEMRRVEDMIQWLRAETTASYLKACRTRQRLVANGVPEDKATLYVRQCPTRAKDMRARFGVVPPAANAESFDQRMAEYLREFGFGETAIRCLLEEGAIPSDSFVFTRWSCDLDPRSGAISQQSLTALDVPEAARPIWEDTTEQDRFVTEARACLEELLRNRQAAQEAALRILAEFPTFEEG